jgi:hypothetical protein
MTANSAPPVNQAPWALKATLEPMALQVLLAKLGRMVTMVPLVLLDVGERLVTLDPRVPKGQRGRLVLTALSVALPALPAQLLSIPLPLRRLHTLHLQNQQIRHPLPRNHHQRLLHLHIRPLRHQVLRFLRHLRIPQNETIRSLVCSASRQSMQSFVALPLSKYINVVGHLADRSYWNRCC